MNKKTTIGFFFFFYAMLAYGQDTSQTILPSNQPIDSVIIAADSARIDILELFERLDRNQILIEDLVSSQNELKNVIETIQNSLSNGTDRQVSMAPWLLIILALITLVSISISFYLYRWRKILVSQPNAMVPEEWGKGLRKNYKEVKRLRSTLKSSLSSFNTKITENTTKISSMIETFMTLQKSLDEKDEEIKRLKDGYDKELYRKFLYRFIRVDQTLEEISENESESKEDLELLKRLMEDAFQECGVEKEKPKKGEDYRQADFISDNPKTIHTENKDEEFKIADIIQEAYVMKLGEKYEVLIPAEVKVFTTNKK